MTHMCCLDCRLRFPPPAGAPLVACPVCDEPLQPSRPDALVGFRIFTLEDVPHPLPEAVAVSLPIPDPRGAR